MSVNDDILLFHVIRFYANIVIGFFACPRWDSLPQCRVQSFFNFFIMLRVVGKIPLSSLVEPRCVMSTKRIASNGLRQFSSFNDSSNNGHRDSSNKVKTSIAPSKTDMTDEAPQTSHVLALPVINRPLFPGVITTVTLTEPATINALENLQKDNQTAYISVFLRKKNSAGVSEGGVLLSTPELIVDADELYSVGTFAQIHQLRRGLGSLEPRKNEEGEESSDGNPDSAASILLRAHRMVNLISVDEIGPPVQVTISQWPRLDDTWENDTLRALSNQIMSTIREVAESNPLFQEKIQFFTMHLDANDPYRLSDFAASLCDAANAEDLQALLEEKDPEMCLHKAIVLLSREREISKL